MEYTWNIKALYQSEKEFNLDFEKAESLLDTLVGYKNKIKKNNKKILKNYFYTDKEFSIILEKLAVFARIAHDDNAKDEFFSKAYAKVENLCTCAGEKLAFAKAELVQLDDKFLSDFGKEFEEYSRITEDIIRQKPHILSEDQEKILSTVSGFASSGEIAGLLNDIEMNHGQVETPEGKLVTLSTGNYNLYLKHPDQEFRKKVMETYLNEYGKLDLTFSELYLSHVKHQNFIAKSRKFASVLDMETFSEEVTNEIMIKNISFISEKIPLLQKFFTTKQKILKLDTFYSSDINANIPNVNDNQTFDDAIKDIYEAFSPLGEDYKHAFKTAIEEGWIDAFPRENKASGGYTISNYTCHPFILLNFDGTAYWTSAIAHEFGHAMHSEYSRQAQPYSKYDYTIFVAEVASLTNEVLYTNFMLKKEKDKNKKMQIICDFLGNFYLNVFNSSMLAEFELFVHETLSSGEALTAGELNQKFISLCNKYFGKVVTLTCNYQYDWERKSHIFRDYYLYKYSTGFVSATAVANKILNDKTGEYVQKYKKFLSLGGSVDPISSLKVAEIDITDKSTYDAAFQVFEMFLNELISLEKSD